MVSLTLHNALRFTSVVWIGNLFFFIVKWYSMDEPQFILQHLHILVVAPFGSVNNAAVNIRVQVVGHKFLLLLGR